MISQVNWDEEEFAKSSYSGGNADSSCLEVAVAQGRVGLRDTKDPEREVTIDVPAGAFKTFVQGIQGGDFAH